MKRRKRRIMNADYSQRPRINIARLIPWRHHANLTNTSIGVAIGLIAWAMGTCPLPVGLGPSLWR